VSWSGKSGRNAQKKKIGVSLGKREKNRELAVVEQKFGLKGNLRRAG